MVTFYAGQKVTAAQLETLVDYTTRIEKSADETVSASTTQQDDNDFTWPGLVAGTYELTGTLVIVSSVANGGIRFQWTWPTGSSGYFSYGLDGIHDAFVDTATNRDYNSWAGSKNTASPSDLAWLGANTTVRCARWSARMVNNVAGTLTLQWAQLNASGTTTIKAGSWMSLKKVA